MVVKFPTAKTASSKSGAAARPVQNGQDGQFQANDRTQPPGFELAVLAVDQLRAVRREAASRQFKTAKVASSKPMVANNLRVLN